MPIHFTCDTLFLWVAWCSDITNATVHLERVSFTLSPEPLRNIRGCGTVKWDGLWDMTCTQPNTRWKQYRWYQKLFGRYSTRQTYIDYC